MRHSLPRKLDSSPSIRCGVGGRGREKEGGREGGRKVTIVLYFTDKGVHSSRIDGVIFSKSTHSHFLTHSHPLFPSLPPSLLPSFSPSLFTYFYVLFHRKTVTYATTCTSFKTNQYIPLFMTKTESFSQCHRSSMVVNIDVYTCS